MPSAPDAATSLSGGSGITAVALVQKVLRRLDDQPYIDTFRGTGAGSSITTGDTTFTVPTGATSRYTVGVEIDFVDDGSFERVLVTAVPSTTTITVQRGHRGTTAATHAADAKGAVQARYMSYTINELVSEALVMIWPDLFEIKHVTWTATTVDPYFAMPADAEEIEEVYQRDPAGTRLRDIWYQDGIQLLDSNFLGSTYTKALEIRGVSTSASDNKVHAIYLARLSIGSLTDAQIAAIVYWIAGLLLTTVVAGESKPDRRPVLGNIPTPDAARNEMLGTAGILIRKEQQRLQEYLPHRNHPRFRMGRHYTEVQQPYHPVTR